MVSTISRSTVDPVGRSSDHFAAVAVEIIVPFSTQIRQDGAENEDLERARQAFPKCDSQGKVSIIRAPFALKNSGWQDEEEGDIDADYFQWDVENERGLQGSELMAWVCDRFGN
ncbi:hypothetical protein V5O48_014853 [Marasmius crinis-equi]|uniref:Uncharacterized protein n=1 Tax=Marasmius crinis-equi TaxID=585013 RepID=A0ABR3EW79_9AGAR